MKKIISLAFLVAGMFFIAKAQNEECNLCGWYVDGVKADKIDCYSFDKLTIVLPYFSEMGGFNKIAVVANLVADTKDLKWLQSSSLASGVKSVPGTAIKTMVKGGYVVYTVFAKSFGKAEQEMKLQPYGSYENWHSNLYRVRLKADTKKIGQKKGSPAPDVKLYGYVAGYTITGYTETYNSATGVITKEPQYSETILSKTYPITCTNRLIDSYMGSEEVDMTPPCSVPGTKVDFNNLGASSTSSSNTNNSTPTNNTPVKTESPVKTSSATGKTIITSVAPTSATAVKPLDKTKAGYFEEKSDDKKYMFRNGYQKSEGVYHGEVREYDNNQLYKIIIYSDGIEDGLYIIFDDGKVSWAGNYKMGKKDGIWKKFKDGQLDATEKYVDGEQQD